MAGPRALLLCAALIAATAGSASAQERTFDNASPAIWGVAVAETVLAGGLLPLAYSDVCESSWGCPVMVAALVLAGSLVAGGVAAGVAYATDAPSDVALITHHALIPGLMIGLPLTSAIAGVRDRKPPRWAPWVSSIGFGLAGLTYATLRRDELARDAQVRPATHMMTWLPAPLALTTAVVLQDRIRPEGVAFVISFATLAAYAAAVSFAEVRIANR